MATDYDISSVLHLGWALGSSSERVGGQCAGPRDVLLASRPNRLRTRVRGHTRQPTVERCLDWGAPGTPEPFQRHPLHVWDPYDSEGLGAVRFTEGFLSHQQN